MTAPDLNLSPFAHEISTVEATKGGKFTEVYYMDVSFLQLPSHISRVTICRCSVGHTNTLKVPLKCISTKCSLETLHDYKQINSLSKSNWQILFAPSILTFRERLIKKVGNFPLAQGSKVVKIIKTLEAFSHFFINPSFTAIFGFMVVSHRDVNIDVY